MLTAEQKKRRTGLITSSIAAGALGLHDKMTPIQAWLAVLGESDVGETKPIERGNLLEDVVLNYPVEKFGFERRTAPFVAHDNGWAGDSCDALYWDAKADVMSCGEGKTVGAGMASGYGQEWTDQVPDGTLLQSHWHLIHWPMCQTCLVPVLLGGYEFEFRMYKIHRDAELHGLLLQDLERWHRDYVVTRKPPPAQAGDHEWLKTRSPRNTAGFMPDSGTVRALVHRKQAAQEEFDRWEKELENIKAQLKQVLGDHEGVKGSDYTIYYRNDKDGLRVDWDALAQELKIPKTVIQKHTREVPGKRALRIYAK
jgi:predicted phage-related endonuclease